MSNPMFRVLSATVVLVLALLTSSGRSVWAQAVCASCGEDCQNEQQACESECGFNSPPCLEQCELAEKLCSLQCQDTACTPTGADLVGSWTNLTQTCHGSGKNPKSLHCLLDGEFKVKNVGTEPAPNVEVLFVLSTDSILDAKDIILKSVNFSSLVPGETRTKQLKMNLHQGSSAAGMFGIAFVDSEGDVVEPNETDNTVPFGPIP